MSEKTIKLLKKRFKNPMFRLALCSFIYQAFKKSGIEMDWEMFQQGVDILCYFLIGAGVFTSFPDDEPSNE